MAMAELFQPGRYYRAREILRPEGPLPISAPTWWKLVKEGRVPEPLRLGAHLVMWLGDDLNTAFASPQRRQAERDAESVRHRSSRDAAGRLFGAARPGAGDRKLRGGGGSGPK